MRVLHPKLQTCPPLSSCRACWQGSRPLSSSCSWHCRPQPSPGACCSLKVRCRPANLAGGSLQCVRPVSLDAHICCSCTQTSQTNIPTKIASPLPECLIPVHPAPAPLPAPPAHCLALTFPLLLAPRASVCLSRRHLGESRHAQCSCPQPRPHTQLGGHGCAIQRLRRLWAVATW